MFLANNITNKEKEEVNFMSYELLWEAKRALEPLLKEAQMRGSTCWGPKLKDNPHSGPNLIFRIGNEMITISQPGERLVMQEFCKTANTKLGQRVRDFLRRRTTTSKKKEVLALSSYTAYCIFGGWRQEFDAGVAGEVDSRGAGSRELLRKIFDEHEKAHPGCDPSNVEIIDPQMVKVGRLSELLAIERAA